MTLPRLSADCGPVHVAGTHDGVRWSITLRDDHGEHVPLERLRKGERTRVVEMLDAAAGVEVGT